MRIFFGSHTNKVDVTKICMNRKAGMMIIIPARDRPRVRLFSDPHPGTRKFIFVEYEGVETVYGPNTRVVVDIKNGPINGPKNVPANLEAIHNRLTLKYGKFTEELPEQMMALRSLTGNEKVLEIGGNIGRNSLVIASILKDSANLVTLESDPTSARKLIENRDANHLSFHVESSALSARRLIQHNWDTLPSEVLLEGYTWVNTITLAQLRAKYNIQFDTLVLDCEGAFYYILVDTPDILNNISLVIMENDYHDLAHKTYVDQVLSDYGFHQHYVEAGGWGVCKDRFFEVWKNLEI